jgi:hypothetical protein
LRRGWTKFWLCTSLVAACVAFIGSSQQTLAQDAGKLTRINELTLAGLRPGKDTLSSAERRLGLKLRSAAMAEEAAAEWREDCLGHSLRIEMSDKRIIQAVTVSLLGPENLNCQRNSVRIGPLSIDKMKTGRGLVLRQPRERVIELYGEPNSSGPSVKGNRELELLLYAFDWAGSDVPQVMEVRCDRATGRVVEMTLAYPSL